MLDPKSRRFTLTHPLHVDQYNGVVRIVSTNSPITLKGIGMPILGYRYQAGTDEIEEHHYTIDGLWDPGLKITGYDLWDADLRGIKPLVVVSPRAREEEDMIKEFVGYNTKRVLTSLDTTTDDYYLALAEELAQQIEDDTEDYEYNDEDYEKCGLVPTDPVCEDDTEDYEGDPDAPMGGSRYTGRNI